jgi:hypothetical protein
MTCGVPQGSTLGPLLFLIYINDIVNCSSILSFRLFADDTSIFYVNKDPTELEIVMNRELKKFYDYCALNKLSINMNKTNFMVIKNALISTFLISNAKTVLSIFVYSYFN